MSSTRFVHVAKNRATPQFSKPDEDREYYSEKAKPQPQILEIRFVSRLNSVSLVRQVLLVEIEQYGLLAQGNDRGGDLFELRGQRIELLSFLHEHRLIGGICLRAKLISLGG